MNERSDRFIQLKKRIAGHRERKGYEETFGPTPHEKSRIIPEPPHVRRLLGQLEFAFRLNEDGKYNEVLDAVLDFLETRLDQEGALTKSNSKAAEDMLGPIKQEAKTYKLIYAAHAHMDMNWMWGYDETVNTVLNTFQSVLQLMEEYPDFCFSQSQGAAYQIVEQYAPDMMKQIQKHIQSGRWEVLASSWVEMDKNMPSTHSMLEQVRQTRKYMKDVWHAESSEIDFAPDAFGHGLFTPSLDAFAGLKYLYHCRGTAEENVLYRLQNENGQEILAYREPYWYNGAPDWKFASGLIELSKRCGGLKTGLVVYGVGDHGGGPARRDIEYIREMMDWPIFPEVQMGTFLSYFKEGEKVKDKLPTVRQELNYFAQGCYSSQSRIKQKHKEMENRLVQAKALRTMASIMGIQTQKQNLDDAIRNILFQQFHDILTGSCTKESKEYALASFQRTNARLSTDMQAHMRAISQAMNTVEYAETLDKSAYSNGAGAGLNGCAGIPNPEYGAGKRRLFHLFNTSPLKRQELVEVRLWDWPGDIDALILKDDNGNEVPHQLLDKTPQSIWQHQYYRVLADISFDGLGTKLVIADEQETELPAIAIQKTQRVSQTYEDIVLDNGKICCIIDRKTGRLKSEQLTEDAGLEVEWMEAQTSSAWDIGRPVYAEKLDKPIRLMQTEDGPLRQSVKVTYPYQGSEITLIWKLGKELEAEVMADWRTLPQNLVPALRFSMKSREGGTCREDIPGGVTVRQRIANDVPALRYIQNEEGLYLYSDSTYGFRFWKDEMSCTLLNNSTCPDPLPELATHDFHLSIGKGNAAAWTQRQEHPILCLSGYAHEGKQKAEQTLLALDNPNLKVVSLEAENDMVQVCLECADTKEVQGILRLHQEIEKEDSTNMLEVKLLPGELTVVRFD